jgi:SAM-dependent methyltransferase
VTTDPSVDYDAIKQRHKGNWSAGDYAVIGTTLQIVGESLCEAVDVACGWQVIDVAAGNGNASLAAARRGCEVLATDYVTALLDHLRERAAAERLPIETRTEDAEALNVPDDSFDAVLSTFGVSFTPNQERAASELVRVCRPGGRIGLANWTPDSFVGHMLRTIGTYVPPPTGVRSPLEWGTDARLVELFGDQVADLQVTEREFVFRFRSPAHFVEVFRTYYGPLVMALETLDDEGRAALQADLVELARRSDTARAGGLRLPSAYLEVVATTAS